MKARKVAVDMMFSIHALKADHYSILYDCVEEGIEYGWKRAHKHGKPKEQELKNQISDAIMRIISEKYKFDDPIV